MCSPMRFTRPGARTSTPALYGCLHSGDVTDDTDVMSRFQRSLALGRASWAVLKSDRSLALYPVFSGLVSVGILLVLGLVGWATKGSEVNAAGHTQYTATAATFVVVVVGYVALAFVQTYFLAGLVASSDQVLHGQSTTMKQGLAVASSRAGRILPWAIVQATVSAVIQAIEERFGVVGSIIGSLFGAAWSIVTFLTVPIIVFEDVGPVNALKRSGKLIQRTWGENLFAQAGLGLLMLIPMLLAFGIGALGVASGTALVAVPLIVVAVVILLVATVVVNALSGIYRTALYRYAVDGQVPTAFAGTDIEHAFGPRKRGRASSF